MRSTKLLIIILMAAVLMPFAVQPVLAGSACPEPEFEFCLLSDRIVDPKFKGTDEVEVTAAAYYEPVDTNTPTNIIPAPCPNECTSNCGPLGPFEGILKVVIRTLTKKGESNRFLMTIPTISLLPGFNGDPCDQLELYPELDQVCKCRRNFADVNGYEEVPLLTATDLAFQEELFYQFLKTVVVPALFPQPDGAPPLPFKVVSVSDLVYNDIDQPFYGVLNFELAVKVPKK